MTSVAIAERGYTNTEILVSTDWVAENKDKDDIRIIESNDCLLYTSPSPRDRG